VLVEKPAALSLAEVEPWGDAGPLSLVAAGFSKRFWPFYQGALARAGAGADLHLEMEVNVKNWGSFAEQAPSPERDVLPHLIDLCRWWTGEEIVSVEATVQGGRAEALTDGDAVRLRLTADTPGEVHLHGYRLEAKVAPGSVESRAASMIASLEKNPDKGGIPAEATAPISIVQ